MQTKYFHEVSLPALGLGCMRLPTDADRKIRVEEVREMVAYAMSHGVNYFDTAYEYHGGMSERVMGEILSHYDRSHFYLADKFPGYSALNRRKVEKIFEEQLSRCQVDYFDFYLLHNVSDASIEGYLDPRFGIMDYLVKQKEQGRIRYLGFSTHGCTETVKRLLEAYGSYMDFAQIQLNYIDYAFQKANEKLDLLAEYHIPVWVMEPLRGGKLVTPPSPFREELETAFQGAPLHETAFRFLWGFPSVTLTLSGMSNMTQLRENIAIFERIQPLSAQEMQTLVDIASRMTRVGTVPCTECRYCTVHCPRGLDIPKLIGYFNEHTYSGGGFIVPSAVAALPKDKRPSACIGCGACEKVCPQDISIREVLASLDRTLNPK